MECERESEGDVDYDVNADEQAGKVEAFVAVGDKDTQELKEDGDFGRQYEKVVDYFYDVGELNTTFLLVLKVSASGVEEKSYGTKMHKLCLGDIPLMSAGTIICDFDYAEDTVRYQKRLSKGVRTTNIHDRRTTKIPKTHPREYSGI